MKYFYYVLSMLIVAIASYGQAPESINYQAVARNSVGDILSNESLSVRFTIKENGPAGSIVFQETHNANTNDFGLFSLGIGQGSVITGSVANINWGSNSHFLQVEIDPGSGYVNLGTNQFVSVPYALYAKEAGNGGGTSYTAGTGIDISGNVISNTGDTDPSDDLTTSSSAGGDATGTFNNLTVVGIQGRSISASAPNTGQVLKWNGSTWAPANDVGGGTGDNWGSQVVQSSSVFTGDGTNSNPLDLSQQGASTGQVLKWNGSAWAPGNDVGGGSGDNWGSQVVQTDATLTGNGTVGNALGIAPQGASNGQVLMWNGSSWVPSTVSSGGSGPWTQSGNDIYYNSGKVGIGTSTPQTGLHVDENTHVLFGADTTGSTPSFYWNADKGALRAGKATSNQWATDSIGDYSVALGSDAKAIGFSSFAMGPYVEARGNYSFAIGNGSETKGRYSFSSGYGSRAWGWYSVAMGDYSTASGTASVALGEGAGAHESAAVAMGHSTQARGSSSFAVGEDNTARTYGETVIGLYATDPSPHDPNNSYNTRYAEDRLFAIGNGASNFARSDAMVVLKNGNVGIGDSDPYSRLRVSGEAGFTTPLVDFEAESISQNQSLLYLTVPSGSPSDAKFIEMMSGFNSRASIKQDGSARFRNLQVTQNLIAGTSPHPGTLYRNSLPIAYGQVTAAGSLQADYGIASVTKLSTGEFRITTHSNWSGNPVIMAMCYNATPNDEIATGYEVNNSTIQINISDGSGNARDSNFYFIIFGTML